MSDWYFSQKTNWLSPSACFISIKAPDSRVICHCICRLPFTTTLTISCLNEFSWPVRHQLHDADGIWQWVGKKQFLLLVHGYVQACRGIIQKRASLGTKTLHCSLQCIFGPTILLFPSHLHYKEHSMQAGQRIKKTGLFSRLYLLNVACCHSRVEAVCSSALFISLPGCCNLPPLAWVL